MNLPRSVFVLDRSLACAGVAFLCLISGAVVPTKASKNIDGGSVTQNHQSRCFSPEEIQDAIADKDVGLAEFNLTEPICIPVSSATDGLYNAIHNGIPDGVVCNARNWYALRLLFWRACICEVYSEAYVHDASTRSILSGLQV